MKPFLPPRSISKFLFTTPSFHILHFSTTPNAIPSYPSRRHEEESRNVRVSVWWDFENCSLPTNVNVFKVSQFITGAVRASGIKGSVTITAFGDVIQLSRANQEALSATGINLNHIPNGGKNSADRSLLVDLMYWVSQNPPPAHLFLISGDRDFASVLHRLRMNNYNILLASSDCAPGVLCSSASIMWQWSTLVRGENLTGKYFNQPPDGPYASWYGHYKAPLEDPFAITGQPSNVKVDEVSEGGPDILRPIPKIVMKQIRNILNSYPKGVSTLDLRTELGKSNVSIDKDYFGYKKFSRFLLAMPQILKIRPDAGGQYLVHSIPTKICGENDSTTRSSVGPIATKDEGRTSSDAAKQNVQKSYSKDSAEIKPLQHSVSEPKSAPTTKPLGPMKVHELPKPYTEGVSEKLSPPLSEEQIVGAPKIQDSRKSQQPSEDAQKTARVVKEVDETEVTNNRSLATVGRTSVSEPRVFEKLLKWWFGPENSVYNLKESKVVSKTSGPEMHTKQKKDAKVSAHGTGFPEVADNIEATVDHSAQTSSLFTKITSWFRSWGSSEEPDDCSSDKSQKPDASSHRLFAKNSFWNDMKAFLVTPKGSSLVWQAKTRSQMGQALQKDGPPALRSLSDKDLRQLVDMLITDKKWVEESAFLSSPFKLAEIAPIDSHDGDACSSNVSSSVVSDMQSQSGSLKRDQLSGEKKCQHLPHSGVVQPARQKLNGKSKSEILADCKNLVQFIVKEHPEGYNLGLFRKLFLERFGYPLELQKVGYHKLATLLQTMPGIRVESAHMIPSSKSIHSGGDLVEPSHKLPDGPQKDEGNESPWDELGPLSDAVSDEKPTNSKKKVIEKMKGPARQHYELLSEDDFSDSEDEATLSANTKSREQRKGSEGNSSLLNILDNWYANKEGSIRKSNSDIVDSSDEYIEDGTSSPCRPGKSSETDISSYGRQKRPAKSYTFVADQPIDENNKLVDGILTSLKKSGELK